MKAPQFYITLALGVVCLVLSVANLIYNKNVQNLNREGQSLQTQIQEQEKDVNRVLEIDRRFKSLAQDMANASVKNESIRQVLSQNNINVNVPVSSIPTPTPSK